MLRSKNNNLIWNGSGPRLETGHPVIGYARMIHASPSVATQTTKNMGESEVVTGRGDHSRLIVSRGNSKPNNSSGQEGQAGQFVKRFSRKI